jgi:hypothetical protein
MNGYSPLPTGKKTTISKKDRYSPSKYIELYKEELKLLSEESRIQNIYKMYTQVRLGKGRKGEDIAEASSAAEAPLDESPFDFSAYLRQMRDSKQRHIQILGRFFYAKGLIFDNDAQVQAAIRRHLRPAKNLAGFSNDQIDGAIQKVERQYPDIEWTLETLVKVLTK